MKAIDKFMENKTHYGYGMELVLIRFLQFLEKEGYLADETYKEMESEGS